MSIVAIWKATALDLYMYSHLIIRTICTHTTHKLKVNQEF